MPLRRHAPPVHRGRQGDCCYRRVRSPSDISRGRSRQCSPIRIARRPQSRLFCVESLLLLLSVGCLLSYVCCYTNERFWHCLQHSSGEDNEEFSYKRKDLYCGLGSFQLPHNFSKKIGKLGTYFENCISTCPKCRNIHEHTIQCDTEGVLQ